VLRPNNFEAHCLNFTPHLAIPKLQGYLGLSVPAIDLLLSSARDQAIREMQNIPSQDSRVFLIRYRKGLGL
jgi:hypothetical protein